LPEIFRRAGSLAAIPRVGAVYLDKIGRALYGLARHFWYQKASLTQNICAVMGMSVKSGARNWTATGAEDSQ